MHTAPGRTLLHVRPPRCPWLARAASGCSARPLSAAPPAAIALQAEHVKRNGAKGILRLGNAVVQQRLAAQPPPEADLAAVRVFYLQHVLRPEALPHLLADVPLVTMPRDELLILQDTSTLTGLPPPSLGLLTPEERRLARKKCVASPLRVHATGGLGRRPVQVRTPEEAAAAPIVGISVGDLSFLVDYLEYADFVADEARPPVVAPLFPHYFADTGGRAPPTAALLGQGGLPLGCGRALNTSALFRSFVEDVTLWLSAFNAMVETQVLEGGPIRQGWLRAPPVGLDLHAELPFAGELLRLLVSAYEHVLATQPFPYIAALEFPQPLDHPEYSPPRAQVNGVQCTATTRDLLDFTGKDPKYLYGVLCPGEVFCLPGNGFAYLNTESMVGNNTDLRVLQSYLHNPYLLDGGRHVPVDSSRTIPR